MGRMALQGGFSAVALPQLHVWHEPTAASALSELARVEEGAAFLLPTREHGLGLIHLLTLLSPN